ncbi:MAG: prenyltransferase [Desulfurococcales archaeon]|nr:prenyltransferase [Desulfurococcales archaeon]
MGKAKMVFLATRPWSFPFTVMVVLIASLLPLLEGLKVSWLMVVVAAAGSVLLHAMVNLLNDYFDYKRGIDRPGAGTVEYRPHPIVHNIMTPQATFGFALSLGLIGLLLAGLAALTTRPLAIVLGLIGFVVAFLYTGPPLPLKYNALGEVGVYIAWGTLIPLGAYYMACGELGILPVIALLPLSLMIVAVLAANNIRDIEVDKASGIRTLEVVLGFDRSRKLFKALIYAAYASAFTAAVFNRFLLIPAALPLITLPDADKVARMFDQGEAPPDADPRVAGVLQKYATLYLIGLIVSVILNYIM